jgi:hypothetical protein
MKRNRNRNRNSYRSPVATGLALFFAIVAAALLLAAVTIDGGMHGAALARTLVPAAVVIGLASVGALSGTGSNCAIPNRPGLSVRAQEMSS